MDILESTESLENNLNISNGSGLADKAVMKGLETKTLEISKLLKQRLQFYKEQNARMMEVFKSLNCLNEDLQIRLASQQYYQKLIEFQTKLETTDHSATTLALSHADRLRKHSNYVSKLKICIKMYVKLNEMLSKEIQFTKWELQESKSKVNSLLKLSPEDLKAIEIKVKRYENELIKFEKRYPWLKDEGYNLPNISKQIESLTKLREEKTKLEKELSVYQGLKPSIAEAMQQLAKIKMEYQQISEKLLEAGK